MMNARASTKIIVVGGGGTLGASTALHLIRSGYTPSNITILDVYPIPSAQSAGHDLNKIMSIRLQNKPDLQLSLEALKMWKEDTLFKPFFHNVGVIYCSSSTEGIVKVRQAYESLITVDNELAKTSIWLESEDEILAKVSPFRRDQVEGWKGFLVGEGGWLSAVKAIGAIGQLLKARGVNLAFGPAGTFEQPILTENGTKCSGVRTADGTEYYADKVILAAGAWSPALVDLEGQCVSKAWVFAHIQLTPQEAAEYKNIPVIYDGEYGFFFEPNEHGVIKVCDEFPGFSHFQSHQPFGAADPRRISVPRSHAEHPTDTYPDASEASIRKAIARFMPAFKDRELFNRSMCWCTDTGDANLLICEHPKWKNFILATGDSGHSFKVLPNIGKHVVELIEGSLSRDLAYAWRWRPAADADALKSRRAAAPKDLADMLGWKHEKEAQGNGRKAMNSCTGT